MPFCHIVFDFQTEKLMINFFFCRTKHYHKEFQEVSHVSECMQINSIGHMCVEINIFLTCTLTGI